MPEFRVSDGRKLFRKMRKFSFVFRKLFRGSFVFLFHINFSFFRKFLRKIRRTLLTKYFRAKCGIFLFYFLIPLKTLKYTESLLFNLHFCFHCLLLPTIFFKMGGGREVVGSSFFSYFKINVNYQFSEICESKQKIKFFR